MRGRFQYAPPEDYLRYGESLRRSYDAFCLRLWRASFIGAHLTGSLKLLVKVCESCPIPYCWVDE